MHLYDSVYVWPPESLFVREKHNNSLKILPSALSWYTCKRNMLKYIYIYIYVLEVCGWFLFGLYANLSQVIWVPYYRKWFQLNWKDGRLWFFFFLSFFEIYGELMGVGCHAYFIPNPQQILSELKSWHNYCFTQFILA